MAIHKTDMDMAREKTIKLDFPVQLADRELTEVTMRRPIMADMVKNPINKGNTLKQDMALIARLCDLTIDDLELLDAGDYDKLSDQLLRFRGISWREEDA